ncbi:MAG: DUF2796 domain-containing protein [Rubrivivax sp.]|nr:DUF2796 domain-containing protein [Rubrivivax sp.]MDZ7590813.1 DUF2796 domain-containing protein [Rubrivivax sp.]
MKTPLHRRAVIGCALALSAGGPALAAKAHQHGTARLDIAVDAGRVSIVFDTPLDNLLGFERAPRTDAERQQAEAAVAVLRNAGRLFRIDPAAGCTLAKVELASAALKLGDGGGAPAQDGHADLEGRFDFDCKQGGRAAQVEVGLFDAFKGLQRLELQVVTPKGQMKATLVRPASRVALVR